MPGLRHRAETRAGVQVLVVLGVLSNPRDMQKRFNTTSRSRQSSHLSSQPSVEGDRDRSHHEESTSSRQLTAVKPHRARLVLRWVTTLESRVVISFFFAFFWMAPYFYQQYDACARNCNAGYTWGRRAVRACAIADAARARANKESLCCRTAALELALLAAAGCPFGRGPLATHPTPTQHHPSQPSPSTLSHHGDGAGTKHK